MGISEFLRKAEAVPSKLSAGFDEAAAFREAPAGIGEATTRALGDASVTYKPAGGPVDIDPALEATRMAKQNIARQGADIDALGNAASRTPNPTGIPLYDGLRHASSAFSAGVGDVLPTQEEQAERGAILTGDQPGRLSRLHALPSTGKISDLGMMGATTKNVGKRLKGAYNVLRGKAEEVAPKVVQGAKDAADFVVDAAGNATRRASDAIGTRNIGETITGAARDTAAMGNKAGGPNIFRTVEQAIGEQPHMRQGPPGNVPLREIPVQPPGVGAGITEATAADQAAAKAAGMGWKSKAALYGTGAAAINNADANREAQPRAYNGADPLGLRGVVDAVAGPGLVNTLEAGVKGFAHPSGRGFFDRMRNAAAFAFPGTGTTLPATEKSGARPPQGPGMDLRGESEEMFPSTSGLREQPATPSGEGFQRKGGQAVSADGWRPPSVADYLASYRRAGIDPSRFDELLQSEPKLNKYDIMDARKGLGTGAAAKHTEAMQDIQRKMGEGVLRTAFPQPGTEQSGKDKAKLSAGELAAMGDIASGKVDPVTGQARIIKARDDAAAAKLETALKVRNEERAASDQTLQERSAREAEHSKRLEELVDSETPYEKPGALYGTNPMTTEERTAEKGKRKAVLTDRIRASVANRRDKKTSMGDLDPTELEQLVMANKLYERTIKERDTLPQSIADFIGTKRFDSKNLYKALPKKVERSNTPGRSYKVIMHGGNTVDIGPGVVGGEGSWIGPNGPIDADMMEILKPHIDKFEREQGKR